MNMAPPKKFMSLRPEESPDQVRKREGISLRRLLDELNKREASLDHTKSEVRHEYAYHNLPYEDRVAQDKLKRLTGALNKLAPDNFYIQLLEIQEYIPVDNYNLLNIFVRQLIDKAVQEEIYSPLYAHVCNALKNIELIEMEDESIYNFGALILDECYSRFCYARSNLNWFSLDEPNEIEKKELLKKEDQKRKLLVGVARFLGDLFKTGMIGVKEIFQYIQKLEQDVNEKSIEALCKLLSTIGKELETSVFDTEFETDWCSTWERIVNLSTKKELPLRQKFLLMNLLDLINGSQKICFLKSLPKTSAEILLEDKENVESLPSANKNKKVGTYVVVGSDVISKEPIVVETEKQILHLLKTSEEPIVEITKWELENFKGRKTWLIYSLTRAVLRISLEGNRVNKTNFLNNLQLLKRYIISRQAEVACMYAVQYIIIVEMKNPKGLLEQICEILHSNGIVSYIAFLDWRENWSKNPVLEINGKAEAQITLANFFIKLFWESIKPSLNYKSIVKELNSFDLEHFVSMSKLPPEIGKRIKLEEERESSVLKKGKDDIDKVSSHFPPVKTL